MFEFPQATLAAICAAPNTFLDAGWEDGYHKLLAYMGANHPEWTEGVKVVKDEGTFISSGSQYREYLKNLINHGVKLSVGECRSYWFIRRMEIIEEGKSHQVICLEYVSQYSDVFTGHGVEYFPIDASFSVFGALRQRVKNNNTTGQSSFGYETAEYATALFGHIDAVDF